MNSDRTAGQWKQIKGRIKEQWGKLTDDEITQLEGHGETARGQAAGEIRPRARGSGTSGEGVPDPQRLALSAR